MKTGQNFSTSATIVNDQKKVSESDKTSCMTLHKPLNIQDLDFLKCEIKKTTQLSLPLFYQLLL